MLAQIEHPTAGPVVLPFEIWLAVMGVALLLVIAIAWLIGNDMRLRKIDRRLRSLEGKQTSSDR
jgi:hypothetical protein